MTECALRANTPEATWCRVEGCQYEGGDPAWCVRYGKSVSQDKSLI